MLDDVLIEYDTDLLKQNLIAGIKGSLPLHGQEGKAELKGRVGNYPDELILAKVRRYAKSTISGAGRISYHADET